MTSRILKNKFLMSTFAFTFIVLFFGTNESYAATKCVNKWSDLPQIKPIDGITNFDNKFKSGRITFKMPSGKTFTIRERAGKIHAETPEGNADIQICKDQGKNKTITAIADIPFLGKKIIVVHNTGGKRFQIIDQNNPSNPVSATVM